MSYEPTNWKDGDLVTSAKLNKMEQGVAASGSGGITFVGADETGRTLNKTWQEIYDAVQSGMVYLKIPIENSPSVFINIRSLANIGYEGPVYVVEFIDGTYNMTTYATESPDDYPTVLGGDK